MQNHSKKIHTKNHTNGIEILKCLVRNCWILCLISDYSLGVIHKGCPLEMVGGWVDCIKSDCHGKPEK